MGRVGEKSRREKEPEERKYRCANLRKVAKQCVFPIIISFFESGGSQIKLTEAAGAEPCGQMRN